MANPDLWTLAAACLGYLLGSVPFGLLLTRLAGYGDIRRIGSGNIGATNVLRTGNKPLAALTLLLDGAKGAAAVLIAAAVAATPLTLHDRSVDAGTIIHRTDIVRLDRELVMIAAGMGAVFGHLYPLWLRFKGGKGVAVALGTMLALDWRVGAAACALWLATALTLRISSASALLAMLGAPVVAWIVAPERTAIAITTIACLVWLKHAANIGRLRAGTEPRIGAK